MRWEHRFGNIKPTFGQMGEALCKIETQEQADEFWDDYVAFLVQSPDVTLTTELTASEVASSNIGYLMGYYGQEERERVYRLFPQATHPIFGHEFGRGYEPTGEEAFAAGERHAHETS